MYYLRGESLALGTFFLSETSGPTTASGNVDEGSYKQRGGSKATAARSGWKDSSVQLRRTEVQASVGATDPSADGLVGFSDLRSRSAYRVFSLTAVWSRPSVSSFETEVCAVSEGAGGWYGGEAGGGRLDRFAVTHTGDRTQR